MLYIYIYIILYILYICLFIYINYFNLFSMPQCLAQLKPVFPGFSNVLRE